MFFKLLMHCVRRAASRADWTAGKSSVTSIAIMAITTSSSTSVKPRCFEPRFRMTVLHSETKWLCRNFSQCKATVNCNSKVRAPNPHYFCVLLRATPAPAQSYQASTKQQNPTRRLRYTCSLYGRRLTEIVGKSEEIQKAHDPLQSMSPCW